MDIDYDKCRERENDYIERIHELHNAILTTKGILEVYAKRIGVNKEDMESWRKLDKVVPE